ncbi:MAG TPA: hypothetical protein PLO37_24150 [Candidatus Hydrogenedentes bacterium]|nr:hypothetical protein [Candidatus Hydrogenedentota bacterium]HPG69956.1 hypothetical protein [Candidatus Hydrogenedentota bacterium]
MKDEKLIIGLPAGSLADTSRGGNLIRLLHDAGFTSSGYERGGPSTFPVNAFLMGWDGRPQEFGAQLALGEVDIAIAGDDWIRERTLELRYEYGTEALLQRVLPLGRGTVRIVIIKAGACDGDAWLKSLLAEKPLITIASEMPYLSVEWFLKKADELGFGKSHRAYAVQRFKTPPRIERGVLIYETWGKTEAKVKNGSVDFGVEITQTGSAIHNYGLAVVDEIMASEAAVWANPAIRENAAKHDLARMFLLNLYGAMYAENKVLLLFNTRKECVPGLLEYLEANRLFADEPTMSEGLHFTEFSVEMASDNPDLPLAQVRYELATMGATHIETIPLESSIPGLDVIDF